MSNSAEAAAPRSRRATAADHLAFVHREFGCNGEAACAQAVEAYRIAVTRELRENEEQLAEAQRIAGVGSWEYDVASGRRTFSDQFCRMFGFEPGASPRLDELFAVVHRDDRPRARRMASVVRALQPAAEQVRLLLPGAPPRTVMARTRVVF